MESRYCHLNSYKMFGNYLKVSSAVKSRISRQFDWETRRPIEPPPKLSTVKSWVINLLMFECEFNIYLSQPREFFVKGSATETYLYMYLHAKSSMVWINKSRSLDCALFYCKACRKRREHERSARGNMRRCQMFLPSSLVAWSLGNGVT